MKNDEVWDLGCLGVLTVAGTTFIIGIVLGWIQVYVTGPENPELGRDNAFLLLFTITLGVTVANTIGFLLTAPLYYILGMPRNPSRIALYSIIASALAIALFVSGVPARMWHGFIGTWHSDLCNLAIIMGLTALCALAPFSASILTFFAIWKVRTKLNR